MRSANVYKTPFGAVALSDNGDFADFCADDVAFKARRFAAARQIINRLLTSAYKYAIIPYIKRKGIYKCPQETATVATPAHE